MKLHYLLSLSLLLTIFSCGKDEEESAIVFGGTINNNPFEIGQSTYSSFEDEFTFNIYSNAEMSEDICNVLPEGTRIFFKAKNSFEKQELFLDLSSFEAFTVTILNFDENSDIIITDGSFQIIENDNDMIVADLMISSNNGTSLEGRFTASLCE